MDKTTQLIELICRMTGAKSAELGAEIQSLWSGYGVIQRVRLRGVDPSAVVIKHIDLSSVRSNRRGWGSDRSHQRKVRSYQVESRFYESFANRCDDDCRVPQFVAAHELEDQSGWMIVLEDLDASGFDRRKHQVGSQHIHACLRWLANFHAVFMDDEATGLWPVGTYWHLATRPDEFAAMNDGLLKQAAAQIDHRLNAAKHQTLVHGDAKVANFCFADDPAPKDPAQSDAAQNGRVAAVDFQYVGRGCGMKDVAYFVSSCLTDHEAAEQQESLLRYYFEQLRDSLRRRQMEFDFDSLEAEWRALYPFAWADFCRFLSGWSPGHWKLNAYTDHITESVLEELRDA